MSQFIVVQVGQCGNQIGSAFWPLALHEYGTQTPGSNMNFLKSQRSHIKNISDLADAFHGFFHIPGNSSNLSFKSLSDLSQAKVKARAVLIDMEDSVVSRFRQGPLRDLFDESCSVTSYPGSANNWAVGYHTHGTQYHTALEETIQRTVEKCDRLHGFLIMHSLGGGTGSGLGTATLKLLAENYPQTDRLVSPVYATATEDVITSPYNVLLATRELLEHATCVFPVENRSLLDICNTQIARRENIDQEKYNASCQPFQDMNSIVVNMLLHLTSGSRFPGNLNMDMNEISTNLVPYPNLHYICSSVSPIALTAPTINITHGAKKIQDELFTKAWSRSNQLIKVDLFQPDSVILSAAHIARGPTSISDLKRNVERFQTKAKFTIWSKDAMKVGLCSVPPAGHTSSLLCLTNTSAMSSLFKNIDQQFTTLYRSKAHVHHYTKVSGFEQEHFSESREAITNICMQYKELVNQNEVYVPRLEVI